MHEEEMAMFVVADAIRNAGIGQDKSKIAVDAANAFKAGMAEYNKPKAEFVTGISTVGGCHMYQQTVGEEPISQFGSALGGEPLAKFSSHQKSPI